MKEVSSYTRIALGLMIGKVTIKLCKICLRKVLMVEVREYRPQRNERLESIIRDKAEIENPNLFTLNVNGLICKYVEVLTLIKWHGLDIVCKQKTLHLGIIFIPRHKIHNFKRN